ncbi:MAG: histone deacetylase family protein, partial [Alphaproteobacteria bacterium]|nr:histone deacetylase family protein [Alphaproteobacteria bacterium]
MSILQNVVVITHQDCMKHLTGPGHPERPERIDVLLEMLDNDLQDTDIIDAPMGTEAQILLAHPQRYIDRIKEAVPPSGISFELDADTPLSPFSFEAAKLAVGAACKAVDMIAGGETDAAFCAMRPPGHHAEPEKAMGFCLFANAYIAARWAQEKHGFKKVAIVDFDVHHGNGTAAMIYAQKRDDILFTSSHQFPFWPNTGDPDVDDDAGGLILDVPLPAGTHSDAFRMAY